MPRKKSAKAGVASREIDDTLIPEPTLPLSYEERIKLRAMFADPVFKKALRNCRNRKPNGHMWGRAVLNAPTGAIVANNTLHEQRGWEAFEKELHAQTLDPVAKTAPVPDDYKTPA